MTKKTIKLSLELASDIYRSDNEELKKLVLDERSQGLIRNSKAFIIIQ